MMVLAHPIFLLLLLLPLLYPIYRRYFSLRGAVRYSNLDMIKQAASFSRFHPRQLLLLLRLVALVLIVVALARPQAGKKFTEVVSHGVDIMLALDTSGSMEALDFKQDGKRVNRLSVVRRVVAEFIKKRESDRMGLIVFGEDAFTQCPITSDHGVLLQFLERVETKMAGNATAIGSAIGVGVKRLKTLDAKSKIIILLTDGESNAGRLSPEKAAEIAAKFKIKIYTIGVGTKGQAPFMMDTLFGKRYVYQDVQMDEESLQQIARVTGARYFRATDTEELEGIYQEIDRLEKREVKIKEYTEYHELFIYWVLPALLLLLLEILLGNTILRKIP
jgi:Ca-activated chloride channel homolog